MNLHPRTRCPYTRKSLSSLKKVNAEHVIYNALGCPKSYSVDSDAKTNADFGKSVDANFLTSMTVSMLRSQHGIESYSGLPKVRLSGKTVYGSHPVDVTIPHKRPVEIHFKKPFIPAEDGKGGMLIAGADWENKSSELIKNFARKGKKLVTSSRETLPTTEVHIEGVINLTHLRVGLMKIAYLAAFEYLGDPFLDDPLNSHWQKSIRATSLSELEDVRIHGFFHEDEHRVLDAVFPKLESHQHAVAVINLEQTGPLVAVRLFGSPLHSMFAKVSDTHDFGMRRIQGKLVICDTRAKSIDASPWENFMLKQCGLDPEIDRF